MTSIHVLPGGTLERYLPLFKGSAFGPTPDQKRDAVLAELEAMTRITKEEDLASRYTDLYKAVRRLPSREPVNVDLVLRTRLATYIHGLQQTVVDHPDWDEEMVQDRLNSVLPEYVDVFCIQNLEQQPENKFQARIKVVRLLNQGPKIVEVSDQTNAGMGGFEIKSAEPD